MLPLLLAASAPAQSARAADLAVGKLLVSSRELLDPNFVETVVLLVQYQNEGVVGLVINRRTKVPLSRLFDDIKEAKGRSDPIYIGGPVGRTTVMALMRSHARPADAEHVFGDVYLASKPALLEKTMASGAEPAVFHVYAGYAGWTGPQLKREVAMGAWHIFPGDAALVFDSKPDSVWLRLIEKAEGLIAAR